jgi:copper(I)-binding protein
MRKTVSSVLFLACLFLAVAGCKERQPVIVIEASEAKLSPALIGVVSVFMKINNTGNADDALLGARTDIPGAVVELHNIEDGKMVKVEHIAIPADSQVLLRAARHHIMILGMPKGTREGTRFELVLTFKRSGDRTISLEVTPFSTLKRFRN